MRSSGSSTPGVGSSTLDEAAEPAVERNKSPEVHDRAAHAHYLRILTLALLLYLVFVVPTNLLVDAHSTFPHVHLAAFAAGRSSESRLAKSNAAVRGPADVVVVGSSRAVSAFPASQPAFSGVHVLNLAVQNTSLPELTEILRFAVEHDSPAEIVVGADFEVFHYEHLLDEFLRSHFNPVVHASEILFEQALSVHATGESLETLQAARHPEGGEDADADLSRLAKFEILLSEAVRLAIELPPKPHVASDRLEDFRAAILDARARGARVHVVIPPVHATILWALDRCGLWSRFEDWKRDMVAVLSDTGAELWDFNGFDEPQCEPIPAESDADQDMRWFTDASHCSEDYGSRILERVLRGSADTLGVRLTPQTIEARLESVRRQRDHFASSSGEQLVLVDRILAEDRERRTARHH